MNKIEFLHLSDIHLKQGNYLEYKDFMLAIEQVIDYGIKNKINENGFIIITGDFTDKKRIGLEETYHLFMILKKLTRLFKVFIVLGQHDGNWNNEFRYHNILYEEFIKNLYNVGISKKIIKYKGCYIYGRNYNKKLKVLNGKNKKKIQEFMRNNFVIFLMHYPIKGSLIREKDNFRINIGLTSNFVFNNFPAHLYLFGDIHKRQIIEDRIFYPGNLININFEDGDEQKGFLHFTINKKNKNFNYKFIPIHCRKFYKINIDIEEDFKKLKGKENDIILLNINENLNFKLLSQNNKNVILNINKKFIPVERGFKIGTGIRSIFIKYINMSDTKLKKSQLLKKGLEIWQNL